MCVTTVNLQMRLAHTTPTLLAFGESSPICGPWLRRCRSKFSEAGLSEERLLALRDPIAPFLLVTAIRRNFVAVRPLGGHRMAAQPWMTEQNRPRLLGWRAWLAKWMPHCARTSPFCCTKN
mmetsp:Transcript_36599/g.105241  ORF Transcript_36599/g.105241 Transcript_36599/m.105241 type:complete len:121 (-) Transcript_36599:33-395(-)